MSSINPTSETMHRLLQLAFLVARQELQQSLQDLPRPSPRRASPPSMHSDDRRTEAASPSISHPLNNMMNDSDFVYHVLDEALRIAVTSVADGDEHDPAKGDDTSGPP